MDTVREIFTLDEDAEITMEMNPGTVTEEKLRKYRQAGVNRLSIGLQSVNDEELRAAWEESILTEEFPGSISSGESQWFFNINVDLISAIPGQTVESWRRTLEQVMALSPEHISAYIRSWKREQLSIKNM
ncbi:MAG: radical SAM protein [Coprococcus sp.]